MEEEEATTMNDIADIDTQSRCVQQTQLNSEARARNCVTHFRK